MASAAKKTSSKKGTRKKRATGHRSSTPELVDISPSPRILQVLGDIEFERWQCFAELIDNSFDEFLEIQRAEIPWDEEFFVTVILPTGGNDTIEVRDNGRGMTLEAIRDAVRAGWTGNDPFENLGLFGMGFNIATARTGGKATVLTKQRGEAEWVGIEIDLRDIASKGDFTAPVVRERADDEAEHGTRVIVSDLKPEFREWRGNTLPSKLGDVYSDLLENKGFKLYGGGQAVEPRKACVWDRARTVSRRRYGTREEIPALIKVNKKLPDQAACRNCRHWQGDDLDECEVCGSTDIDVRERRIRGWLGIQRYLHNSDFGFDFIRNGRKILIRDKRLFEWDDPNDDEGPAKEYPVEVPPHGRIVGEIHIDHVPVNYQKNAFEYDSREWKAVVRALRGDGPVRPQARTERGYDSPNNSPLARLFDGYRRNNPGLDYLVPGNGEVATHERARDWAKAFRDGDPEYQSDEKWFEAAKLHDELKRKAALEGVGDTPAADDTNDGDVIEDLGLGEEQGRSDDGEDSDRSTETEQERQERYKSGAEELGDLSNEYTLPSVGTLAVTAYLVSGSRVSDAEGTLTPVYLSPRRDRHLAFIDSQHPAFTDFGSEYADFLLFEVAHHLKTRASSGVPLGSLVAELKERYLSDAKIDPQLIAGEARTRIEDICDQLTNVVGEHGQEVWQALSDDERRAVEARMVAHGASAEDAALESGDFLRYLPALTVPRVVERHPEIWLDGHVFTTPYATLDPSNEEARQIAISRLVSHLTDVALLSDGAAGRATLELRAGQLTMQLLSALLATAEPVAAA